MLARWRWLIEAASAKKVRGMNRACGVAQMPRRYFLSMKMAKAAKMAGPAE